MTKHVQVLFDNRGAEQALLSILIPVRGDRRLFRLLDSMLGVLDERVHVCIVNDAQPEPLIRSLPSPLKGVVLYGENPISSLAEKINLAFDQARSSWVAIIESDTIMHPNWWVDVCGIIKQSADNIEVHLGGEVFEKGLNCNNIIYRKDDRVPRQAERTISSNDTAWFMECEYRGIPLVRHTFDCMLYHEAAAKERSIPHGIRTFVFCAHDYAYMAVKFRNDDFFRRCILAEGYYLVRGLINLPLLLLVACYYWLRRSVGLLN